MSEREKKEITQWPFVSIEMIDLDGFPPIRTDKYPDQQNWTVKLFLIQSKDRDVINKMEFKFVGDNLCYRHEEQNYITITSMGTAGKAEQNQER